MYFIAYSYAIDLNDSAIQKAINKHWDDKEFIEESIADVNLVIKIYP